MFYGVLAVFGILSGTTAVLFGFGGGFVAVPVVFWLLTLSSAAGDALRLSAMNIAVATSTCAMIVNAAAATRKHNKLGNIQWQQVFPLAWYIAIGAASGAVLATLTSSGLIRTLFVIYITATIADCLLRKGFLVRKNEQARYSPLGHGIQALAGVVIGVIASFLGVGGSIMTVPLMRRCGMEMKQAVATANPLSLPVALAGTVSYAFSACYHPVHLGAGYIGYINFPAFVLLSAFSFVGVKVATPLLHRISDRNHARIYIALLIIVLLSMLL